uniref:Uncharacterized protein n=1 Tax=Chromera velia CCMP2878 TaxID=1169474 RepID=A0A0G4G910_9ALVE|eukprot:Cvel_4372.t1-p1 / transcript=Cvel_4372.t1 / gene=Cvel_4372 / organism=Chromera_velia_CCMP2878 / gene_product=hypothetical protein / transcript_product=hypothetical protein / location=Cvel_scaffold189:94766-97300(+) / protein_length=436 / sequence_SO=supercontig / SO=protein_coding / is_pseudo=false
MHVYRRGLGSGLLLSELYVTEIYEYATCQTAFPFSYLDWGQERMFRHQKVESKASNLCTLAGCSASQCLEIKSICADGTKNYLQSFTCVDPVYSIKVTSQHLGFGLALILCGLFTLLGVLVTVVFEVLGRSPFQKHSDIGRLREDPSKFGKKKTGVGEEGEGKKGTAGQHSAPHLAGQIATSKTAAAQREAEVRRRQELLMREFEAARAQPVSVGGPSGSNALAARYGVDVGASPGGLRSGSPGGNLFGGLRGDTPLGAGAPSYASPLRVQQPFHMQAQAHAQQPGGMSGWGYGQTVPGHFQGGGGLSPMGPQGPGHPHIASPYSHSSSPQFHLHGGRGAAPPPQEAQSAFFAGVQGEPPGGGMNGRKPAFIYGSPTAAAGSGTTMQGPRGLSASGWPTGGLSEGGSPVRQAQGPPQSLNVAASHSMVAEGLKKLF